MSKMNRLGVAKNPYQDNYKRVLCVCSGGVLRSPTMAYVLSQNPYNYNTRACGISEEFALIHIDDVLVHWADEIVCAEKEHTSYIQKMFPNYNKGIYTLDIPDIYVYRDPQLITMIKKNYNETNGFLLTKK